MKLRSIWKIDTPGTTWPTLDRDIEVDVAIIGAGITGITTAELLCDAGVNVVVLEARRVGEGTTGYSTGNLYAHTDMHLERLRKKYDATVTRQVCSVRAAAIDRIEGLVARHGIACDFTRVPFWLVAEDVDAVARVTAEVDAALEAGLGARQLPPDDVPLPFANRGAAHIAHQAQLQPLQYVRALAEAVGKRCPIYEHSPVVELHELDGTCTLTCAGGQVVRARSVVMATHTPKGNSFAHTVLAPYRELALAVKLRSTAELPPAGIFWIMGAGHHTSMRRVTTDDGTPYLVCLGQPHKVGQSGGTEVAAAELEAYVRAHFDVAEVAYVWGAQAYRPADGLPYIGPRVSGSHVHLATGFAADGLVWGTVAAEIISDSLRGRENDNAATFAYTRHTPIKSAVHFVRENANVALQYLKDWPLNADVSELSEIRRDDGKTIVVAGHKLAVYRDMNDRLQIVSAVCTHLGCIVQFNRAERSWDCPCHGSRFGVDGTVLEGPAFVDLPKVDTRALTEEGPERAQP